jgi:hypothetical protein
MSSCRHSETYGLTERVNNTFQHLLRCFYYYDGGTNRTNLLPQVQFQYNASRALGIEHTPFEANFGFSLEKTPDLLLSIIAIKSVTRNKCFGTLIVTATQRRDARSHITVDSPALCQRRQGVSSHHEPLLTWTNKQKAKRQTTSTFYIRGATDWQT